MSESPKETRVQFAARRGVPKGRVSNWIRDGVLSGDALIGRGAHRRIVVEIAEAQLAQCKREDVRPDARRKAKAEAAPAGRVGRNVATSVGAPMLGEPGMRAVDDSALVRICLTHGGFPRALEVDGKTFWLDAAGGQWTYGRAPAMRGGRA